jgi:hypothetical protein
MNIEFPDQFIRRAARAEIDDSRGGHSETSTSPPRRSSLGQFQLGKLPLPFEKMPSFPITPPTTDADLGPRAETILSTATHVLSTEAAALSCLSQMYATDPLCRNGFVRAVEAIAQSQERGGQNHIIGVGKSGKIGKKLVASMKSLGLVSSFLHPLDATHGDLGQIRKVSYDIPYTSHALFNLSFFFFFFFFFLASFSSVPVVQCFSNFSVEFQLHADAHTPPLAPCTSSCIIAYLCIFVRQGELLFALDQPSCTRTSPL